MNKLTHRKATLHDVPTILALLLDDSLGQKREAIRKRGVYFWMDLTMM